MYIYHFWAFVTIWLLQFVVANMLQGRKKLAAGQVEQPLKGSYSRTNGLRWSSYYKRSLLSLPVYNVGTVFV